MPTGDAFRAKPVATAPTIACPPPSTVTCSTRTPEVMTAYNQSVQRALAKTVWGKVDHSWYKTASGKITNNWYGSALEYWWKTRHSDLSAFEQETARRRAEAKVAAAA